MACEPYQAWLMDAALGALAPEQEAELRAHVEQCAACRAEFERQRVLVSAVDRAIEASVAEEPSPDLLARVRMRIGEQPAPAPRWFAGWWPVAAGAVAMMVLVALWWGNRDKGPTTGSPTSPTTTAGNNPGGTLTPPPVHPLGEPGPKSTKPAVSRAPKEPPVERAPASAEVLVPGDQKAAVNWLYGAMQRQPARTTAVLAGQVQAQAQAAQPLSPVARLELAPLEIGRLKISEPASSLQ